MPLFNKKKKNKHIVIQMKTICFLILILKNYIDFACKWCRIVRVHVLLLSFVYRENSVSDRPRILPNRPCMHGA